MHLHGSSARGTLLQRSPGKYQRCQIAESVAGNCGQLAVPAVSRRWAITSRSVSGAWPLRWRTAPVNWDGVCSHRPPAVIQEARISIHGGSPSELTDHAAMSALWRWFRPTSHAWRRFGLGLRAVRVRAAGEIIP